MTAEQFRNKSISHATHRYQDLIPKFLECLKEIAPDHYEQLMTLPFGPIPAHAMEDDDAEWWDSEEAGWLLEGLFDALNEHAPEGTCFGAHEGNGSDFGFWEYEDPYPGEDWAEER